MAGTDHDYWLPYDLTSDASGDADETKSVHGVVKGIYVDYAADVDAGCDVTVQAVIGVTTITLATKDNTSTDGWMTLVLDPLPAGGDLKVVVADAGDTKVVRVIMMVI